MAQAQPNIPNRLIRSLPAATRERVQSHLESVDLKHGGILFDAGEQVRFLYFPAPHSMVSLITTNEDGALTEVGVTGSEGILGFNPLMGAPDSSHRALVQIPGSGWRMKISDGLRVFATDADFRNSVLRYVHFILLQLSQTALCNRLHSVEERLARWLLICDDRAGGNDLPLTHEMLGHMLGTRRSSVTLAAAVLQKAGLIHYQRGRIRIENRKRLEEAACSCIAVHEKNLRWLEGKR